MKLSSRWNLLPPVLRNAIYGFSTLMLPMGLSFIATPIVVGALGNARYGIYQLVLTFLLNSFNLNFGRAITKKLAEPFSEEEPAERFDYISAAVVASVGIAIFGAILIWAFTDVLVVRLFAFAPDEVQVAGQAFRISAAALVFTSLAHVLGAVIQGLQRFDVYSRIFNLQSLALVSGNILLAVSGYGVRELLIWNLLTQGLVALAAFAAIRRLLPGFVPRLFVRYKVFAALGSFSAGIVAYQIVANLLLLFERGLITARFGPSALGFYAVAMMLGFFVHSVANSTLLFLFPLSSALGNDREKLTALYRYVTKAVACMVVLIAALLVSNARFAMVVWMGAPFAEDTWYLMALHTITFSLLAIRIVSWQLADGLGHTGYNFWIFAVGGALAFVLMVFAPAGTGTAGIAAARLAGFAMISAGTLVIERALLGQVFLKFWIALTLKLLVAAAAAGVLSNIFSGFLGHSWVNLALILGVGSAVFGAVLYFLRILDESEIKVLKERLRGSLHVT